MQAQLSDGRKKLILNVIYRPPQVNFSLFFQEFEKFISDNEIQEADVIYLGHLNIWDEKKNTGIKMLRTLSEY